MIVNTFQCDALIFDLDGVLIDSTEVVVRHWKEWAQKHNVDEEYLLRIAFGYRTIETMRMVAPQVDAQKEYEAFAKQEVQDTGGIVAMQGAKDILRNLPPAQWAIVTSCGRQLALARIAAAKLPMPQTLITSDDVENGKPNPEPYLQCSSRLRIAPEDCTVVEDSPAGLRAAKRAGMIAIGVATTHTPMELIENGADLSIEKLLDLKIVI